MRRLELTLLLWSVLTGCSQDTFLPDGMDRVQVVALVPCAETGPSTRTSMSGYTASFIAGDKIGVSETLTQRSNVPFTAAAGGGSLAWTTPLATAMYWFNSTATHTFYAYYPYNAANSGNTVSIPVLATQTFGSVPDVNADMLVAGPKTQVRSTGGNAVAFTFNHAFSLLQFTISTSLLSTITLKSMTVTGGNNAGGTNPYGMFNTVNTVSQVGYNLATGTLVITPANNTSANFSQSVNRPIPSTGLIGAISVNVYVLILPGTYVGKAPSVQIQVSSLLGGNQQTPVMPLNVSTFLPGKVYPFTVKIGNGLIDL